MGKPKLRQVNAFGVRFHASYDISLNVVVMLTLLSIEYAHMKMNSLLTFIKCLDALYVILVCMVEY